MHSFDKARRDNYIARKSNIIIHISSLASIEENSVGVVFPIFHMSCLTVCGNCVYLQEIICNARAQ